MNRESLNRKDAAKTRAAPLYQEIMARLLKRINNGEFNVGSLLPSEHQLLEEFSVSRMTVNRALKELEAQGYVNRVQGVGTFVADLRPQSSLLDVQDIAQDIRQRGHLHCSRVIHLQAVKATSTIAAAVEVESGCTLFHSQLVHSEDETPVQIEERYVLPQFAPDYLKQQFSQDTPHQYLMAQGPIDEVEHTLHAAMVTEEQGEFLQVGNNEPCLVLTRRTWSCDKVVTYGRFYYPGSRYRLFSHYLLGANPESSDRNKLKRAVTSGE